MDTIKVLLRAGGNPRLAYSGESGEIFVPLDIAAYHGHLEITHELIQQLRIRGCGGAMGGVTALQSAAMAQQMEVMELLTSAGVVDTGIALLGATVQGRESSVKFLLQQWKRNGQKAGYLETCDPSGRTPLVRSVQACRFSCSPRIARVLVDAGADTATAVRLSDDEGTMIFNDTPLALAELYLGVKNMGEEDATESQLHCLEAMRRLLMRVEAVHAVSWLWARDVPRVTQAFREGMTSATQATSTPLTLMSPMLRRRAGRPRVLLAAMSRWVVMMLSPTITTWLFCRRARVFASVAPG